MKQRLKKLLAVILSAAMCFPALPADTVKAAADPDIRYTDEEQVFINFYDGKNRSASFNDNWKFYYGSLSEGHLNGFNDADWDYVDLPHDFSITQEFTSQGEAESGFLLGGTGWYRKHFMLPEKLDGQRILINFDGIYKDAVVYVNEHKVGEHHYGYTPFAFDITDYVECDGITDNVIAVEAVNNVPSSRWYSGSGIYRDVTLIVTNPVHIAHNGTYVTTPNLKTSSGSDGTVNISVDVQNDSSAAADVTVRNTLYKKGNETPAATADTAVSAAANAVTKADSSLKITSPDLWSIDTPNLYYVRTEILKGNTVLDSYDTEFGFKWYEFVGNTGFVLNGKNTKIKGVCMHHDQGALGAAAYHDAIYRQLSIMKEMGTNTIRITHNPGAEVFVDICNEIGLLVIEEAFDGWGVPKNYNDNDFSVYFDRNLTADNEIIDGSSTMTWSEFVLKSMIKRDRNDASIILWSMGNEIQEGALVSYDWTGKISDLIRWAEEVDTAHPLTSGSNNSGTGTTGVPGVNNAIQKNGGVPGFNYQARYSNISTIDGIKNAYDVILWSETASAVNSRGIYTDNSTGDRAIGGHLTSYDNSCVGWGNPAHETMWWTLNRDWIAGECVWTGFDYIGEPTPWNNVSSGIHGSAPDRTIAAPNSSYFGIVETTGFPKDNYYLYRSQWNQNKGANTLNLVTAWDPDNMKESGGKTPVWVYTNAASVKLYRTVNGVKTHIGTATRKALDTTTTAAGHVHYEYTTASNDDSICTTSSGSNYDSIYSVFNVAFAEGTISAEAFDEAGNDITDTCKGNTSVSTPGEPTILRVSQDKQKISADGSSLAYITVDVTDQDGNLDTTADHDITFKLTGEGKILGVDNGDQATVDKYQQPSVITDSKTAHIKAFSGKALVIVSSTKNPGTIRVEASSNGLAKGSAEITSVTPDDSSASAITSYFMPKHCYVPIGKTELTLADEISVMRADGEKTTAAVTWGNFDKNLLNQAGTFTISGTIAINGEAIGTSMIVHVYKPIVAAKNIAIHTPSNVKPTLPTSLMTCAIDETSFEEFPVTWDMEDLDASDFSEIGKIIKIKGIVDAGKLLGKTFPAIASVRVAKGIANGEDNIAPAAATLSQNCDPTSDNLNTVNDENRFGSQGDKNSRWTDWDDEREDRAENPPAITMTWDTVHVVNEIRLFYAIPINGVAKPKNVTIELSSDGITFTKAEYLEPVSIPAESGKSTEGASFRLKESSNPIAVRVILERDGASAVGLTEIEVISTHFDYVSNTSADLKLTINGQSVNMEENKEYEVAAGFADQINFNNENNAALTFIPYDPKDSSKVKVIAASEDGTATKTYLIKLTDAPTAESIDKLQNKLEEYKKLNSSLYSAESLNALNALIAQIESQMGQLSESELQAKLKDLDALKNNLKPAAKTDTKNALTISDKVVVSNVEYQVLDPAKKTVAAVRLTNKKASKITIQNTVTIKTVSCNVVQISTNVFKGAKKLKTVKLGKFVTNIDKNAFSNCPKLKTVTFQETAVTISKGAFKKTKSGITVKGTKKLKGKQLNSFKKKLKKAGFKNPKLR